MQSLLVLLITIFSISAYSQENIKNKTLGNSNDNFETFKSIIITLGLKNGYTQVVHNEKSSALGYTPLNKTSKITINTLDLGVMKEFIFDSKFSFSGITNLGILIGKDKGLITGSNTTYSDKLAGNYYSIGGSLNLNIEAFKLKIQPYVFSSLSKIYTKTLLDYSQDSNNPTSIQYRTNSQITDIGAGIRFIDGKVDLMSYFSVNYSISNKVKSSTSSVFNKNPVSLTNSSSLKQRPLTFALGFGFLF